MLALQLARRELRGGVRGLRTVLVCLALGVGAIAAVGSLRSATNAGFTQNGRAMLGGDLEIGTGAQPPPPTLLTWLRDHGAEISQQTEMRTLLVAPSGERNLIDLRAVDRNWPMLGAPVLNPNQPVSAALRAENGRPALLVDPIALDRLELQPGDTARIGDRTFVVTARLISTPDRISGPVTFGAPAIIRLDALGGTGIDVPGALVSHIVRVVTGDPRLEEEVRTAFPNEGWLIRTPRDVSSRMSRFVDQTALFLTLVGFTALLVGGIGVANGVRAWLSARAQTLAILRCLGASSRLVLWVCLIQVMALSVAGIAIGLLTGASLAWMAMQWLRSGLAIPVVAGLHPVPLGIAALYGILVALCFALWPLGRAARLPGASLFRNAVIPEHGWPGRGIVGLTVILCATLLGLAIGDAEHRFAFWFCAGAVMTLVTYRAGSALLVRVVHLLPRPAAPGVRLGLGNIHRPGAATSLMLISIGLGLSTLACVALLQANLRREITREIPKDAPSFYFIDIQPDQMQRFGDIVHSVPTAHGLREVPSLRARIVAVNGVPADQVQAAPDTRWALRGDRGLTYAATPPAGTNIVAGAWWPADYRGTPLVSVDARLARGWGLGVGGTVRVNVMGRDIDLTVANLREIAWRSLGLNFVLVASPGLLEAAPHTDIATVVVPPAEQGKLLRLVSDALSNVTGIDVQSILNEIASMLGELAAALGSAGLLTLVAGGTVLVGAVAAGQQRRTQEAVILKTLGATRAQIRCAWLVEFGILGLAAGILAAIVGTVASWAVMRYIMDAPWAFTPGVLAETLIGALALMLLLGYAGMAVALRAKAAPLLRNE
ncbi:MAG: FtsX-like permease family protein [Acetobacteraceae bacterium]|nr:FtsX-like permease family protein [Acetobacteraceae bacterium]